jgi:hypothetical protein
LFPAEYIFSSRDEDELVAKLVWPVKLVAELPAGVTKEVEVARLEHSKKADLGVLLQLLVAC